MPYTHHQLLSLYRAALLGCGLSWSAEEVSSVQVTDNKGATRTWGDVMRTFATIHQGTSQGGAYQVGRFLGYCIREGLLTEEKMGEGRLRRIAAEVAAVEEDGLTVEEV